LRVAEGFLQARGKGHREGAPDAAASYVKILALLAPREHKIEGTEKFGRPNF
jgi:hypothetical protein